jgi:hypothetical protein
MGQQGNDVNSMDLAETSPSGAGSAGTGNGLSVVSRSVGSAVRADVAVDCSVDTVDPMLSMIERALTDPSVSIDKLERVIAIADDRREVAAKRAFNADFAMMQAKLPIAEKGGKGHSGKYARQEDIVRAVRPALAQHGFALSHRISQTQIPVVTAVLSHRAGHAETTSLGLPLDRSGNKTDVHALASAITYATRYTTIALLGIASSEDDDGNAAGAKPVEDNKLAAFKKMVADTGSDVGRICQHYSVETIDDLNAKQIAEAMSGLAARKRKQNEAAKAGVK